MRMQCSDRLNIDSIEFACSLKSVLVGMIPMAAAGFAWNGHLAKAGLDMLLNEVKSSS